MYIHSATSIFVHSVITKIPTDYATTTSIHFPLPFNPGTGPTIDKEDTTVNSTHTNHIFIITWNVYDTFHAYNKALNIQLLESVDNIHIKELYDEDIRQSMITTLNVLAYIYIYGSPTEIDDEQIRANLERMATLIKTIFVQLKMCMRFTSEGIDPITTILPSELDSRL